MIRHHTPHGQIDEVRFSPTMRISLAGLVVAAAGWAINTSIDNATLREVTKNTNDKVDKLVIVVDDLSKAQVEAARVQQKVNDLERDVRTLQQRDRQRGKLQ